MLEWLMLRPDKGWESWTFRAQDDDGSYANLGTGNGTATWLVAAGSWHVYMGGWHFHPNYGPKTEGKVWARLAKAPPAVRKLLPKRHPKSMGMAFGMYATSPEGPWQDMTGLDPECRFSAQYPECVDMYGSLQAACRWIQEGFERPDAGQEISAILRGRPLTEPLARALMPKFDGKAAIEGAILRGYPLDEGLRAPAG
jgi:hypothetical protein